MFQNQNRGGYNRAVLFQFVTVGHLRQPLLFRPLRAAEQATQCHG